MQDERPTTADLLEAWRETTRAAELAERLAALAADAADQADQDALAYEKIVDMAERAAPRSGPRSRPERRPRSRASEPPRAATTD